MKGLNAIAILTAIVCAGFTSTSASAQSMAGVGVRALRLGMASTISREPSRTPELADSDPSESLWPNPDFIADGTCGFAVFDNSDACNQEVVQATNNARTILESLPALSLSLTPYEAMTLPEQLFVIANVERLARGIPPIAGLTTQLDTLAQAGANINDDPSFPAAGLAGGAVFVSGGANWAGGWVNPLGANYVWMYDDGGLTAWGHRDNILGGYATASICSSWGLPGVQDYMGAAASGTSFAEIFVGACGAVPTDVVFTWQQALQLLAPSISSMSPAGGPLTGGQRVTVTGSGFQAGMSVTIGGTTVTPTVVSATSFTFITPAEPAGSVQVQVTTSFGPSALTSADRYTYGTLPVITSVAPATGLVTGGQTVTVTGTGFTAGMTATIGGTSVTPSGVSATSFTFTTPAEAAGTVQVQGTTLIGASALSPADAYTYEGLPMISAVTPSAGPVTGGQVVTVTGSGFVAGMTSTIGGTTVIASGITASSFTFTTPAKSAGYDQVQVTNLAGASALTPAAGYIYAGLGSYFPLTPFRILDTRSGLCGIHTCAALGAGQTLALQITGYTDARSGRVGPHQRDRGGAQRARRQRLVVEPAHRLSERDRATAGLEPQLQRPCEHRQPGHGRARPERHVRQPA